MLRALTLAAAFLLSPATHAAPDWVSMSDALGGSSYLDRSSITVAGTAVTLQVLRSYDEQITLGVDPATGADLYPHRSAKVQYRVNCAARKVALDAWVLYSGNLGDGRVMWMDQQTGPAAYADPARGEESYALAAGCAAEAAMGQQAAKVAAATK